MQDISVDSISKKGNSGRVIEFPSFNGSIMIPSLLQHDATIALQKLNPIDGVQWIVDNSRAQE